MAQRRVDGSTLFGIATVTLLYFLAAGYLVSVSLDVLTADAVSYLRIARYYAEGRFDLAVNSCWGPMLSWLLVPAVFLKIDLPLAARIVQALSGFGFAVGVAALTRRFTEGRGTVLGLATGCLLALPMIPLSITPDMTLAFLMTVYFFLATRLLDRDAASWAVAAGLVGGLAFLTKHYALPFVLAHLVLTAGIRWFRIRRGVATGPVLRPVLMAGVTFLAVSAPWIATMSVHDGTLTVSSLSKYVRASSYSVRHGTIFPDHRLQRPREGRLVVSENRLEGKYGPTQLPSLTSATGFKDALGQIKHYGSLAVRMFKSADLFGLLMCAAVVALLRATWSPDYWTGDRGMYGIWVCASVALYTAGYVVTNVEERLLWPAWGLLLALALGVFVFPPETAVSAPGLRPVRWFWGALLVVSVGFNAADQLVNCSERVAQYADLRLAAQELPFQGCFAVNGKHEDLLSAYTMAYWSETPFLGRVDCDDPDTIASELGPFGETQLLLVSEPNLEAALKQHPQFEMLKAVSGASSKESYCLFAFHPSRTAAQR
jgi:hypothetical protein